MLNTDLHLHQDTLDPNAVPRQATRDGFGKGIVEAAEHDSRVVVLCADVTESVRLEAFREEYPERYIELGVAEQNMAAVASGLANYGKVPFIATFGVFSPGRNWEQIRTTVALAELPVKIMGFHTGVTVGEDGASHQMLEDITLMRVLPHMELVVPIDAEEARKAVRAVAESSAPSYVRFTRPKSPVVTTLETPFVLGRADYLWHSEHPEVTIIGAGPILYEALMAAHHLSLEGIGTSVLNVHTVRPMDIDRVKEAVARARAVVTVEEHQILGGIGGTIAEIVAQNTPVPIEMVAVHDRFGQSGTAAELMREYRLDHGAIMEAVRRVRARK